MQRCESDDCITPASHVLAVDGLVPPTEVSFCEAHFQEIEQRCAAAGAERKLLLEQGVSERMADRIIEARIDRRAV